MAVFSLINVHIRQRPSKDSLFLYSSEHPVAAGHISSTLFDPSLLYDLFFKLFGTVVHAYLNLGVNKAEAWLVVTRVLLVVLQLVLLL